MFVLNVYKYEVNWKNVATATKKPMFMSLFAFLASFERG